MPKHLLSAISLTKTGRWHAKRQEIIAWPWTVYAEGRGQYLPNEAAAIEEVKTLKAKGGKNIDVGCMQVNLHFHPKPLTRTEIQNMPLNCWPRCANAIGRGRKQSRIIIPKRKDSEARRTQARKTYRLSREKLKERLIEASARRFTQTTKRKKAIVDDTS